MKKLLFLCLFIITIFPIYSQVLGNGNFSFQMLRKNSRFFGYYLPLDFVEDFERTRDWVSSRKFIDESEYFYIRLDEQGIWAQKQIPAGWENIPITHFNSSNGIENFAYEISNNNEIIISDNNGKKFKKVSNSFEQYYWVSINNYLGRIVLQDFIKTGEVHLENDIITIPAFDYGKFRIETFCCFKEYDTNLLVYGFNRGWQLDMDVKDDKITIFTYASWIFANRKGKRIYWTNKK